MIPPYVSVNCDVWTLYHAAYIRTKIDLSVVSKIYRYNVEFSITLNGI